MSQADLPPCSIHGCSRAAGVIIKGVLYCGEHASRRLSERANRANRAPGTDEPGA